MNENERLMAKDLEPGDERGLAKGCCLAYLMSGHDAYLSRARCYLERGGIEAAVGDLMREIRGKVWAAL